MPPLVLDDDEAIATAVALRTAAGNLTGMEQTALRALAKLEQVLPGRLRAQVSALPQATATVAWQHGGSRVDAATLALVAAACRDREVLTFDYNTRRHTRAARRVEPHHLVSFSGSWFLVAHDVAKDDWRIFRLDRIDDPRHTRHRFTQRTVPGGDPAAYVADKIATAPARYRASPPWPPRPRPCAAAPGHCPAVSTRSTRTRAPSTAPATTSRASPGTWQRSVPTTPSTPIRTSSSTCVSRPSAASTPSVARMHQLSGTAPKRRVHNARTWPRRPRRTRTSDARKSQNGLFEMPCRTQ